MPHDAKRCLEMLGMDGRPGLVEVNPPKVSVADSEYTVIREEARLYDADYVYVRLFADGRPPLQQVYIYDNTNGRLREMFVSKTIRRLWNRGHVPLMYVFTQTEINIYSCTDKGAFMGVDGVECRSPFATFALAADAKIAMERFSGGSIDSGMLWEREDRKNNSASKTLIEAIREFDSELAESTPGKRNLGRRMLILCFMAKYLEERKILPSGYVDRFLPVKCNGVRGDEGGLFAVLSNKTATIALMDDLHKRFNGDVFLLAESEKKSLDDAFLSRFANIIQGKTLHSQKYFWRLYSFQDIPVELISYVYQCFVENKGSVYTPSFLVDLLVGEAISEKAAAEGLRIIDPACGSGIFLVGVFRRLVWLWRKRNGWVKPDANTLKSLLVNSIHGVDVDHLAAELTMFSLNLALCDALDPRAVWDELRFPKLKDTNIYVQDFFDYKEDGFDLVIGNPPFISPPSTEAAIKAAIELGEMPDRNEAYLFLERGLAHVRKGGSVCLVQPAGFLYNIKAQVFRKRLFEKYTIPLVMDFVSLRKLFSKADVKVCAVLIRNHPTTQAAKTIHAVFRESRSARMGLFFELDHYDVHRVPQSLIASDRLVWRANLLGGRRVFEITRRISKLRTLGCFIKDKGWTSGEGYTIGNTNVGASAAHLVGKKCLPSDAFNNNGIHRDNIATYDGPCVIESPRSSKRYDPPMILIKEHEDFPIEFWDEGALVFGHRIVSINGAPGEELREMFDRLSGSRDLYRFFLAALGSVSMVGRDSTVLKRNIVDLPYPEDASDLLLAPDEDMVRQDVMDYMLDFVKRGCDSRVAREKPSQQALCEFGKVFCGALRDFLPALAPAKPRHLGSLLCYPFSLTGAVNNYDWSHEAELAQRLEELASHRMSLGLHIQRIVTLFDGGTVFLVKPNLLRYWLKSVALTDSDSVFAAAIAKGKQI